MEPVKMRIVGSRQDVYNGLAQRTSGGLRKDDLFLNGRGEYVSLRMSQMSKDRMAAKRQEAVKDLVQKIEDRVDIVIDPPTPPKKQTARKAKPNAVA